MNNKELIAEARVWTASMLRIADREGWSASDGARRAVENHAALADALEAAERKRDESVADNAALLMALNHAIDEYAYAAQYKGEYLFDKHGDGTDIARLRGIAEADHPGAALLARMERLETRIRIADHIVTRIGRRPAASGDYRGYAWAQAEAELGVLIEQYNAAALDALSESEATG